MLFSARRNYVLVSDFLHIVPDVPAAYRYIKNLSLPDAPLAMNVYRSEAKEIDRLQREILETAKDKQPFDVFIFYKESGENGERTVDSFLREIPDR